MKMRYLLLLAGLAVLTLFMGLLTTEQANAQGKPIDFVMKDTTGKSVKLSTYRNKVVLIDVWATWCPYCVKELPNLIQMQADAVKSKKPLQFLGVSVDTNKGSVPPFVKQHGFNYPVLFSDKDAMKPFGDVYGLPTKFIIDKRGVLVDTIIGAVEKKDLEKRLAKYLK